MVNSRNKGAAFERKIVNRLNSWLEDNGQDERVKRNLDQYQDKGMADIYWRNFAIECKCYAGKQGINFAQERWWKQVCESAGEDRIPLLIYKFNRGIERFVLPAHCMIDDMPKKNDAVVFGNLDEFFERLDDILVRCTQ